MKTYSIRYGIYTGLTLIGFFSLMSLVHLIKHVEFSFINLVIAYLMTATALKATRSHSDEKLTFLEIFGICIQVSMIGYVLLALFIFFYLNAIDTGFLLSLKKSVIGGNFLDPFNIVFFLIIQGITISVINSFILSLIHKRQGVTKAE